MVEFIRSQTLYLSRFNQKCPELRLIILLPDTFLNLLKEYFISSVLFHLSKLIKQLLFDINLPQTSKGSCFMNKLYNKEMDIAIGLNDFFSQIDFKFS